MKIAVGVLGCIVLALLWILISYRRQIKSICRQLQFLEKHESNMIITSEVTAGGLGELTRLLNESLQRQKKERMQNLKRERMIAEIYTNLSHDIRTPLTSLDGYFQLLEEAEQESNRQRYLKVIQERIASLKEMLEELFTYTKLQSDEYQLKMERQNLNQIVKETLFSYYDSWMERDITPVIDLAEKSVFVNGNEQAIRRTIQNIIKNGLDHGRKEIWISLKEEEGEAVLVFKNKMGQEEEIDTERIFERFYKADEARSKNSTGLGLSIAKGFVERMNGRIQAVVEEGWFSIVIRLKEVQE